MNPIASPVVRLLVGGLSRALRARSIVIYFIYLLLLLLLLYYYYNSIILQCNVTA